MTNNIKAIIFDFMGVLLFKKQNHPNNPIVDAIDGLMSQISDDVAFKQQVQKEYHLNENGFQEILEKINDKYEMNQELWDLLPELRLNYKLAIINNGATLTLPLFEKKYQIKNNFDLYVNSAIEGVKKPDPKIYLIALKGLGIPAEECLYMDDQEINIAAANKLGMKVIWWENKAKGMEEFTKFYKNQK